jgi:hypothetical protein
MKNVHGVMMSLLLCAGILFPRAVAAQVIDQGDVSSRAPRFDLSPPIAPDAAQGLTLPKRRSPGGQLLRNTLIGAGVGATLIGVLAIRGAGDCGNCDGEYAKAILGGAMYGALFGAAIRIHPSRHPTPGRPQRQATINPRVGKHVKAVDLAVRF